MSKIDIFRLHDNRDADGYICVHGLSSKLSEQIRGFGGRKAFMKFLDVSESAIKDWQYGRAPVPLFILRKLFPSINFTEKSVVLTVKRSKHKVRLQLEINKEFAYFIGLILGDGSLAGTKSMDRGGWRILFCGADEAFMKNYISMVSRLFGIEAHLRRVIRRDGRSYFEAVFASKVVHRLLTNVFDIPAGRKCDKIRAPDILLSLPIEIQTSFLRGLFDTDGSISRGEIKFATTSRSLCKDISTELEKLGFSPRVYSWSKGKYLELFEIRLAKKADTRKFCHLIGSSHPRKAILLEKTTNYSCSPVG